MDIIDCLRAKSIREGVDSKDENLLLKDHLKEVVKRALKLKEFYDKNKENIDYQLNDNFFKTLIQAAFLHDLGKISYFFQKKVYRKEEKESEHWKTLKEFFRGFPNEEIDHEILSVLYSFVFNGEKEKLGKIRTAILLHHYNDFYHKMDISVGSLMEISAVENYINYMRSKKNMLKEVFLGLKDYIKQNCNNEFIKKALDELKIDFSNLDVIERGYNISSTLKLYEIPYDKIDYEFLLLLGCLRRCDYSASANVEIERENNLSDMYDRMDKKIKSFLGNGLWQEKILEKNNKKNLILVAPTGAGKTEFALLWAKKRKKKFIYTLPLRVALNDLYRRFREKYFDKSDDYEVGLLHSTAFIEFMKEEDQKRKTNIDDKLNSSKMFSYPVLLTTADQVLLSSLKYYGFDKILALYPFSSVVIDEIQAYTPDMMAVIIKTIKMIQEMDGDILITTATFPPYLKEFFDDFDVDGSLSGAPSKEDLKKLFGGFDVVDISDEEYNKLEIKNHKIKRHKIEVINSTINNEEAEKEIKEILNKNESILIVVNTISKAVDLYEKLKEIVKDRKVFLLHSRLIEKVKKERIEQLKEELEKGKNPILVATQVVEASVDIDFDILITEISPIESQIQRWGRVWRNKGKDYDSEEPNIYIFLGIDRGTVSIYDEKIVEKTAEVLKEFNRSVVLGYEEEKRLIEKVYEGGVLDNYVKEIKESLNWLKYWSAERRSEAQEIFRKIVGVNVFIPHLIEEDDEIKKAFKKEILEEIKNREYGVISFKEIIEKVKTNINNKYNVNELKWKLKEIIYEYSLSIPFYDIKNNLSLPQIIGFYILSIEDEDDLKEIKEKGYNKNVRDRIFKNKGLEEDVIL